MTAYLAARLDEYWKNFGPELQKIFSCARAGEAPRPCASRERVVQNDLARVLGEIGKKGRDGFYRGWVADKIAIEVQKAGGVLTIEDLQSYAPKEREVIAGTFNGLEVVGMPPPSSGGVLLLQLMAYVDLARRQGALDQGFGSSAHLHAMATGMSLAYADRKEHFGDPDFAQVPVAELLSPTYLQERWKKAYDPDAFKLSEAGRLAPGASGTNTTHISVIDKEGNAVAMTITVNGPYGSGVVPAGTGVVLNNEMNDFNVVPEKGDRFKLTSGARNEIEPGKRPLSSMSPTIVRDAQGWPQVVIGGQGGPRITTATFSTLVNRYVFGMSILDAVIAPRVHHQWKPNVLEVESFSFGAETLDALRRKGHELKIIDASARLQALERWSTGEVWGGVDPRTEGHVAVE